MKEVLLNYVNYNLWANTHLTEVLKGLEPLLLDKEIKSSFPSLRKTIYHIWAAEEGWYKRLHGESLSSLPEAGNDFLEFTKKFHARSHSFISLLNTKDEKYFTHSCSYKDIKGNPHTSASWQMIHHCMNHSTFHRGQLVTMLREVEITNIPATDLIAYFRELNRK